MYLSPTIEKLVKEFMKLPGVGQKTAFRYALFCLKNPQQFSTILAESLVEVTQKIKFCKSCNAPNEEDFCELCINPKRDNGQICLIESYKDLIAIETTNQYQGKYHILGGVISPIDGIGAEQLNIDGLMKRIREMGSCELIMALNPTIEGDTTIYYISKLVRELPVKITTISRGISFGGELDYTDDLTLGRSILARQPYEQLIRK